MIPYTNKVDSLHRNMARECYMLLLGDLGKKPGMVINHTRIKDMDEHNTWPMGLEYELPLTNCVLYEGLSLTIRTDKCMTAIHACFPPVPRLDYSIRGAFDHRSSTYAANSTLVDEFTYKHIKASSAESIDDLYAKILSARKRHNQAVNLANKHEKILRLKMARVQANFGKRAHRWTGEPWPMFPQDMNATPKGVLP